MAKSKKLTVIDNNSLRGVLAPADVLSKEKLQDMIDFLELSDPAAIQETADRIKEADKNKSWTPLSDVRKEAEEAD